MQVAEADEAYNLMIKKNVVGSLFRTNELVRALKGMDPVIPKIEAKPTFQFHKQLKFLSEDLKDRSEDSIKVCHLSTSSLYFANYFTKSLSVDRSVCLSKSAKTCILPQYVSSQLTQKVITYLSL